MELVTVHTALNSADAELVSSSLEAAGFHPIVKDELSPLTMATGGILVQVPDIEAEECKTFLAEAGPVPDDAGSNGETGGNPT